MNKLTLVALLGVTSTSAHPHFLKMLKRHHHHHKGEHGKNHHGKHHKGPKNHDNEPTMYTPWDFLPIKGKVPEPVQCEFEEGDILEDIDFYRQLIGGTFKNFVRGWYNSNEAKVDDECLGDWMVPQVQFQKEFWHQIRHDPMSTTIEDAHTAANNFVDLHWKNRDFCHVGMIKDDFYNWCLDNEDTCLGKDGQIWNRMYENGPVIFGKIYDLAGIMFLENDECYTDEQMIDEHNRVVEDIASLASYIMGFNLSYDPTRVEQHYTWHDFKHGVKQYYHELCHKAHEAMKLEQDAQKNIFGAHFDIHMPTQEDITSYLPETPATFGDMLHHKWF